MPRRIARRCSLKCIDLFGPPNELFWEESEREAQQIASGFCHSLESRPKTRHKNDIMHMCLYQYWACKAFFFFFNENCMVWVFCLFVYFSLANHLLHQCVCQIVYLRNKYSFGIFGKLFIHLFPSPTPYSWKKQTLWPKFVMLKEV